MSFAATLAEASKYDVDKLLDRAGSRAATAREKFANNSRVCFVKDLIMSIIIFSDTFYF